MNRPARTWLLRGIAFAIILGQVVLVRDALPTSDRWFLHSDDHESYILARHVARSGTPTIDAQASSNSSTSVQAEADARLTHGRFVSIRPPGLFYVLAPGAAISLPATFYEMELLVVLSLVAFYIVVERVYGPLPALAAMTFLAFTPNILYWEPFLMSNIPGLGGLCLAMLLLLSERPWVKGVGAGALSLTLLVRFEFLFIVGGMGLAWLLAHGRRLREEPRLLIPVLVGGLVGAIIVGAGAYAIYGTPNIIEITRAGNEGSSTLAKATSGLGVDLLSRNYQQFVIPLIMLPFALAPLVFWRPKTWVVAGFGIGVALLTTYFLAATFLPQRLYMAHAYTRYLIPVCALGAMGVAVLTDMALVSPIPRRLLVIIVLATIANGVASYEVATGPLGLGAAREYTVDAAAHAVAASQLPHGSYVIGEYGPKTVVDVPVVEFLQIPNKTRQQDAVSIVHDLLSGGHRVFMAAASEPHGYAYDASKYGGWFDADVGLAVRNGPTPYFVEIVPSS